MNTDARRQCEGKSRLPNRQLAKLVAKKLRRVNGDGYPLHAYYCRCCGTWHVGHVPGERVKRCLWR